MIFGQCLILYALCRPEAIAKEALDLKFTLLQKKYVYFIIVFVTSNCLSMVNIMRRTAQLSYVEVYMCVCLFYWYSSAFACVHPMRTDTQIYRVFNQLIRHVEHICFN